jgi:hypothetical protein
MALWVHVHGGYPNYKGSGEAWNDTDFEARNLVKALKGAPFNGYSTMRTPSGAVVTIRQDNRAGAFRIFGEWAVAKLAELGVQNATLVPVPSSSCVAQGTDRKGLEIGAAITQRNAAFPTVGGLWWREARASAASGGDRHADLLLPNLMVAQMAPTHVVLIDDVISSGGHLLACARALREHGHTVEHALCAAQTVHNHPADMWAIESRDLEANPFENLLLSF